MVNHTEASNDHRHRPIGHCSHAVASSIIQRHRDNRQRFDSADYEMAQRVSGPCAACTCGNCTLSNGFDLEQEPEPDSANVREQLRCLRLQRFDSADWVLQNQCARQNLQSDKMTTNVAQSLMNRHALKTCAFVGPTPAKNDDYLN